MAALVLVLEPALVYSHPIAGGHVKNTTCAAMSPNGQWVVSGRVLLDFLVFHQVWLNVYHVWRVQHPAGDVTGAVRLWGAKGEHAQKNEYKLWETQLHFFVHVCS